MTPAHRRAGPPTDRRGLTNGNGIAARRGRASGPGLTNGRGATNGLTNGLGRVNGLTNGLGRTNGLTNGLTNDLGRTNGTGAINGLINGSYRRRLRQNPFGVITQRDLRVGLSLVVLTLLLLGPLYLLLSTPPPTPLTGIVADGNLSDWAGIDFLEDSLPSPNTNIRLRAYSAVEQNGYLSFAIRVEGLPFADTAGVDGVYVFIDADGNALTGYAAREVGAEYMLSIRGRDNAVTEAGLLEFQTGALASNWSAWRNVESVRARASADGVEVQLEPDAVPLGTRHAFLVHADDYEGNQTTASVHFDLSRRALRISQDAAAPIVAGSGDPLARLTFTAFGGPVDVTSVALSRVSGPGAVSPLTGFQVLEGVGSVATRDVPISFLPADAGRLVSARVDASGVSTSGDVPVTVDGPDVVAYLVAAPGGHRVDGYFGEWVQLGFDPTPIPNRDVDVMQFGANRTGSDAFVYADVAGRVFGGSGSPERFVIIPGGGGGPQGPPTPGRLKTGEDLFRAYIDVDSAQPSGAMVLGILADYLVEVRGVHGRITSTRAYEWSGGQWTPASRAVSAANGRAEVEAGLDLAGVPTGDMRMALEATDWQGGLDATDVYSFRDARPIGGTRGSGIRLLSDPPGLQEITATPLDATPTMNGVCGPSEYAGGETQDLADLNISVGMDGAFLWVCVIVDADTVEEASDYGVIMFDRNHNGTTAPQADDRRFWVNVSSTDLWDSKGNAVDWEDCGSSCDAGDDGQSTFTGGNPHYEYKIHWSDVVIAGNSTAGFAFFALDAPASPYFWGSSSVDITSPDTWGHITIPEFHDLIAPVAVVGVIYLIARRRRRDPDP